MVLGYPLSKLVDHVAQLLGDEELDGMEQRDVGLGDEGQGGGERGGGEHDGELGGHMVLVHKVQVHMVQDDKEQQEYKQALDDKELEMVNSHKLVGLVCNRMGLGDVRHQHRLQHRHIQPQLSKGLSGNNVSKVRFNIILKWKK